MTSRLNSLDTIIAKQINLLAITPKRTAREISSRQKLYNAISENIETTYAHNCPALHDTGMQELERAYELGTNG